jgi:hypothetical protein
MEFKGSELVCHSFSACIVKAYNISVTDARQWLLERGEYETFL